MGVVDSLRDRWEDRAERLRQEKERRYDESMRELNHEKVPLQKEAGPPRQDSPLERIAPDMAERARYATQAREHPPERVIKTPTDHTIKHNPGPKPTPHSMGGRVVAGSATTTPTEQRHDPLENLSVTEAMEREPKPHERLAGKLDGQSPEAAVNARVETAGLLQKHRDEQALQLRLQQKR